MPGIFMALLICLNCHIPSNAQMNKSQVTANYFRLADRPEAATGQMFGYQQGGIGVGTSLGMRKRNESVFIARGLVNYTFRSMSLPLYSGKTSIHRGTVGLSGIWNRGGKNTWFVLANSHYFGDAASFSWDRLLVSGIAFCNRKVSTAFQYQFGLSYSFVFGPGIPLPLLGLKWRPTEKSQLSFQFPFNLQYKEKLGKHFAVQLRVRPMGSTQFVATNQYFRHPNLLFSPFEATSRLRIRQTMVGVGFTYAPQGYHRLILQLEAGLMGRKTLTFQPEQSDNTQIKIIARPGTFLNISLRFPLQLLKADAVEQIGDDFMNLEDIEWQ